MQTVFYHTAHLTN